MQRTTRLRHAPGTVLGYIGGKPIYPIAGGSGEGEPQGTPPAAPPEPPKPSEPKPVDWQAEAEKWKGLSRKHEEQAKANAQAHKDLEELRKQNLTESERAVSDARDQGLKEGRSESRQVIARFAVDAAAAKAGRSVSDAVLARLNLADLVGDDNRVDEAAVQELVAGFAPATPGAPPPDERRNVATGQGTRSSSKDRGGSVANGRELYAERHQKKT